MGGAFGRTPVRAGVQKVWWCSAPKVTYRNPLKPSLLGEIKQRYECIPYEYPIDSSPKATTILLEIFIDFYTGDRVFLDYVNDDIEGVVVVVVVVAVVFVFVFGFVFVFVFVFVCVFVCLPFSYSFSASTSSFVFVVVFPL